MEVKRIEAMQAALDLFMEKGYHDTTMADIANACKMSKATLYKMFPSKEDLIAEVVIYSGEEVLTTMQTLDEDTSLTPRERLMRKLEAAIRLLDRTASTHSTAYYAMPRRGFHVLKRAMRQQQQQLIGRFHESIVEAFGPACEPVSWDITLCALGTMQMLLYMHMHNASREYAADASFLYDCMEGVAQARKGKQPFCGAEFIQSFHKCHTGHPAEVFQQLHEHIDALGRTDRDRAWAALKMLQDQIVSHSPNWLIIDGMLAMLQGIDALEPAALQPLQRVIAQRRPDDSNE